MDSSWTKNENAVEDLCVYTCRANDLQGVLKILENFDEAMKQCHTLAF